MNKLTSKECCLCNRCRSIKAVREVYSVDRPAWRVQGFCDRCGKGSLDLWPMTRKPVLDRLAEV